MRFVTVAIAASLAAVTSGCATLENGTSDEVHVVSDPPGARVNVSYDSKICYTPCTLDVDRKMDFTVAVKMPGYDDQQTDIKAKSIATSAAVSHDLTPDYLGRVLDDRGGANMVHVPNPVIFKLVKTAPANG